MASDESDTNSGETSNVVRYRLLPQGTLVFAAIGKLTLLMVLMFIVLWECIKLYGYHLTLWLNVTAPSASNDYNASYVIALRG